MSDQSGEAAPAAPSLRSQASAQQQSSPKHKSSAEAVAATLQAQIPSQQQNLGSVPVPDQKSVGQVQDCPAAQAKHLTREDVPSASASTQVQNPPEFDKYLDRVRALVSPEDFKKLFSDHFCPVEMCSMMGVVDGVKEPMAYHMEHWTPQYVFKCRDKIKPFNGRAPASGVLILESIEISAMEAIGMAFDVDPGIFVRHMGPIDAWKIGNAALDQLSSLFSSSRQSPSQQRSSHGLVQEGKCNLFQCQPSRSFRYHGKVITELKSKEVYSCLSPDIIWPMQGTERMIPRGRRTSELICRISCLQVSAHGWVIFTDPELYYRKAASRELFPRDSLTHMESVTTANCEGFFIPSYSDEEFQEYYSFRPFRTLENLFSKQRFGVPSHETLDGKLVTRLLFGAHGDPIFAARGDEISLVLPVLMCMSVMQSNTEYLRRRLLALRHTAIANPDLTSFQPLILLRRNIADTEKELRERQAELGSFHESAYQALRDNLVDESGLPETLAACFEPMLEDLTRLSKDLDHEVNLIVASVTVLDSAAAKHQTQRSTVLTALAAVYLPLSLAASIFGMDIKQWAGDNDKPSYWAVLVAVAALGGATAAGLVGYAIWRWWLERWRSRRRQEDEEMYKMA